MLKFVRNENSKTGEGGGPCLMNIRNVSFFFSPPILNVLDTANFGAIVSTLSFSALGPRPTKLKQFLTFFEKL